MTTIGRYMIANISDHVDPITGEVNDTSLAEDCYYHFHPEQSDEEIPEVYFETAIRIAESYEIKTGVREGRIGAIGGLLSNLPSDYF